MHRGKTHVHSHVLIFKNHIALSICHVHVNERALEEKKDIIEHSNYPIQPPRVRPIINALWLHHGGGKLLVSFIWLPCTLAHLIESSTHFWKDHLDLHIWWIAVYHQHTHRSGEWRRVYTSPPTETDPQMARNIPWSREMGGVVYAPMPRRPPPKITWSRHVIVSFFHPRFSSS